MDFLWRIRRRTGTRLTGNAEEQLQWGGSKLRGSVRRGCRACRGLTVIIQLWVLGIDLGQDVYLNMAAKEQANRKKHGVDFRTAARVFLDPYVIEFDDFGAADELRFNAIGLVDGRMLFVTYTMSDAVVRIMSARGAEPHEKRKYHEV
jgi:uncharacterized protein